MEPEGAERRKEPRYALEAEADVELSSRNQVVSATTVNLSGSGALLHFKEPVQIAVGDDVVCDFKIRHGPDRPLPYWGVGRVVRLDGSDAAIELSAGGLNPLEPLTDDSSELDPANSPEARPQ